MRYKIAGGFILFLVVVLTGGNVSFSTAEEKSPRDTSGVEAVRYPAITNDLSDYEGFERAESKIKKFIDRWELNGASLAIVRDGKLVVAKGYGYADKEDSIPVEPTHLFRIASVSKLITAIAIMKLVEEGRLSLDDKVFGKNGIFDNSIYGTPVDKRAYDITVRHLLMHEGGWTSRYGDHMFMPHYISGYMEEELPVDLETIISFALSKKLHFTPGSGISYSNLGYCILGEVIEQVSGSSYMKYVQTRVLHPIGIFGMQYTSNRLEDKHPWEVKYYDVPGASLRASVYGTGKKAKRTYEGTDYETLGAAGGWMASPSQIMKLIVAVDGYSEKADILSCNTIEDMTTLENPDKYGYGWVHAEEGNWWRTGTLSGTSAFVMRRNDGISYMFVTNTGSWKGSRFAYEIKDMMQDLVDHDVKWWPQHDLFAHLPATQARLLTLSKSE